MVALDKPSIANIQRAKDLEKLKKFFNLSLLRGKDKNTYIRAIACSLLQHGYVTLGKGAEVANVKREDVTNVKALVWACRMFSSSARTQCSWNKVWTCCNGKRQEYVHSFACSLLQHVYIVVGIKFESVIGKDKNTYILAIICSLLQHGICCTWKGSWTGRGSHKSKVAKLSCVNVTYHVRLNLLFRGKDKNTYVVQSCNNILYILFSSAQTHCSWNKVWPVIRGKDKNTYILAIAMFSSAWIRCTWKGCWTGNWTVNISENCEVAKLSCVNFICRALYY